MAAFEFKLHFLNAFFQLQKWRKSARVARVACVACVIVQIPIRYMHVFADDGRQRAKIDQNEERF